MHDVSLAHQARISDSTLKRLLLQLDPQAENRERLTINQFPYEIGRDHPAFSGPPEAEKQTTLLSRNHCRIVLHGGIVCLEDTGSTNGTWVNGNLCPRERPTPLHNGDLIAIGGPQFTYAVLLESEEPAGAAEDQPAEAIAAPENKGTVYIQRDTGWIDLWTSGDTGSDEPASTPAPEPKGTSGWQKLGDRVATSGAAFLDRYRTPLIVLVGAIVLALGYSTLVVPPEEEISNLILAGEYAEAGQRASLELRSGNTTDDILELGTTAAINDLLPRWQEALAERNFERALAALQTQTEAAESNSQLSAIMAVLRWSTEAQAHLSARPSGEFRLFSDPETIQQLLRKWESLDNARAQLQTMVRLVPAGVEAAQAVLANARTLRRINDTEASAATALIDSVRADINANRSAVAGIRLDQFERQYPQVAGLSDLRADLATYQNTPSSNAVYRTPLFRNLKDTAGGVPEQAANVLSAAEALWRSGEYAEALTTLRAPGNTSMIAWLQPTIDRFADNLDALEEIRTSRSSEPMTTVRLFARLDPELDQAIVSELSEPYAVAVRALEAEASERRQASDSAWTAYQEKGPITVNDRLDGGVTERFRELANLLKAATVDLERIEQIYIALQQPLPDAIKLLAQDVRTHIAEQVGFIERLAPPGTREEKLELLGSTGAADG